ncbi:MAG: CofH family radical SAM protein [Actinobacteria bacterium]|nr:CofH family radical SAM protein [Actinomycetota bacterium]
MGFELKDIAEKIESGERLSKEDGLKCLKSNDLLSLGLMADSVRKRKTGDIVTFVGNHHICYSNICINSCDYCSFGRKTDDPDAFTLTLDQIRAEAIESKKGTVPEILFMGSIHPDFFLEFFKEAIKIIKSEVPEIKILAFSPVEIDHFAKQEKVSVNEILRCLKTTGLSAITGGGAEIFSQRVRKELGCENKISGDRWLEIMEAAHLEGIASNASMLYGFIETDEERIDHLIALRGLQDKTKGFTHFLPFAFAWRNLPSPAGYDDLKMLAASRLMLDNFNHIRSYWCHLGLELAQVSLLFGADDLNGLKQKGRIIHSSGAVESQFVKRERMIDVIKRARRIPRERDVLFNLID